MLISKRTIKLLDDFAKVNAGIVIRKNDKLRTINPMKSLTAVASLDEEFDFDLPIYNLKEFTNTLKTFFYPEIVEITDDDVFIKEFGRDWSEVLRYKLSTEEMITSMPKEKYQKLESNLSDSAKISLKIGASDFARILKVAKTLDSRFMRIYIGNGATGITVGEVETTDFSFMFPYTIPNIKYYARIRIENIKKMSVGDYEIVLTDKPLCKFLCSKKKSPMQLDALMNELPFNNDATIEYIVACENDFKYEEIS